MTEAEVIRYYRTACDEIDRLQIEIDLKHCEIEELSQWKSKWARRKHAWYNIYTNLFDKAMPENVDEIPINGNDPDAMICEVCGTPTGLGCGVCHRGELNANYMCPRCGNGG